MKSMQTVRMGGLFLSIEIGELHNLNREKSEESILKMQWKCGIIPKKTADFRWERMKKMDSPTVLRTARFGGFVKEDVLAHVDALNAKIFALEEKLAAEQEKNRKLESELANLKNRLK